MRQSNLGTCTGLGLLFIASTLLPACGGGGGDDGVNDTVAPVTNIDDGPATPTTSTTTEFSFSASEADSVFECRLDTGVFLACTSPARFTNLTPGEHRFEVRATDAAGNTDQSPAMHDWTIVTFCQDGLDNDNDGWIDAADPDCGQDTAERGLGTATCNDGLDNDGDSLVDSSDPECRESGYHEVLAGGTCVDVCPVGVVDGRGSSCELWSEPVGNWIPFDDGGGNLHNRARGYISRLRDGNMAAGGVFSTRYTDTSYTAVSNYGTVNDSAIWTGTYLASEALRLLSIGAEDAREQIARSVETLHDWWTISGDPGYLARFAAPADSPQPLLDIFDPTRARDHLNVPFKGGTWHWKGDVSRDQYQGVLLGYSLAYEATDDEQVRGIIREDIVTFVEQLMRSEVKNVSVSLNGLDFTTAIEMPYTVFTDDETANGLPQIEIDLGNLDDAQTFGFREFHPQVSDIYRQIPGLGFLPDIPRPGTAIMLGAAFRVAIQVTENVPSYANRRELILDFYRANVDRWLDIADEWAYTQTCGEDYFGIHIVYQPAYNWARLESDVTVRNAIRQDVVQDRLWNEVKEHNNVLFAFITASQLPGLPDSSAIVADHVRQLALFPPAPRVREGRDNTGAYPESQDCPGDSTVAVNLDERGIYTYLWQKDPWKLVRPADLLTVYPGVDYLIAYWLGRYHEFIAEDAVGTCLQWRSLAVHGGGEPSVNRRVLTDSPPMHSTQAPRSRQSPSYMPPRRSPSARRFLSASRR